MRTYAIPAPRYVHHFAYFSRVSSCYARLKFIREAKNSSKDPRRVLPSLRGNDRLEFILIATRDDHIVDLRTELASYPTNSHPSVT
jgi:hypothetical protein